MEIIEIEVKQIVEQVLLILVYLHSLDPPVIHRDIKPDNIIRDRQGNIYLVDFGAVQNTYHNTLMQGSTVVGTYGYMSPEQFRAKAVPATALHMAVSQENLSLIKLLIQNNIAIDTVAKKKYLTPLHQAIRKNNLKIAKLMLEKGAATNIEVYVYNNLFELSLSRIDMTPISEAVFQGNVEAIALLIDYDTSFDLNYDLSYAIVEQISNNNLEVIELLL